jgi:predicted phosphodiesterase
MRVALISDMHGNAVAFDAVLEELRREHFDHVVSLGDVAQGGAQPAQCVDRLRELGCRCVFGNSDAFVLTLDLAGEPVEGEALERLLAVGRWSQQELGEERLAFLRSFEPTVELDLSGQKLVCCHATPRSNEEVVLPGASRDEISALMGDADAVAAGHVHVQWLRRAGRGIWFCAGSVGLVYDHETADDEERPFEPWAEYAILTAHGGVLRVEFRRVSFDVDELRGAILASGSPDAERQAARWKDG